MATTGTAVHRLTVQDMVVAFLDGLGREKLPVVMMSLPGPLHNGVVHCALNLDLLLVIGRMVENLEDVGDDLAVGHTGIFPGVNNPAVVGVSIVRRSEDQAGKRWRPTELRIEQCWRRRDRRTSLRCW